ncbi:hypothetical protein [Hazenella coriacea]|nr:hypothetical protein [Hazenella coriacea]
MKVGAPTIISALIGTALVGWSNINAGMAHGIEGIILGLVTPTLLICSEAMLSHTILNLSDHRKAQKEELNSPEIVFQSQSNVPSDGSPKSFTQEKSPDTHEAYETQNPINDVNLHQMSEKTEPPTNPFIEDEAFRDSPITNSSSNKQTDKGKNTKNEKPIIVTRENQSPTPAETHQIALPLNSQGQKSNVVQLEKKTTSSPLEFATTYYEKNGKHISRRGLAEEFGITEYRARKILEQLKKQIS